MSRAFVKEDAPDVPLVIPPRAPLPAGVPNYVTPAGLAALRAERSALEAGRSRLDAGDRDDASRQRERAVVAGRLRDLVERITTARLVDPSTVEQDRVRFGAAVTVRAADGVERTLQIVGVDEAAVRDDAVAFTSPIARALTGKRAGETAALTTPRGEEALAVVAVRYEV
jgi:transcription elongation factor GreB